MFFCAVLLHVYDFYTQKFMSAAASPARMVDDVWTHSTHSVVTAQLATREICARHVSIVWLFCEPNSTS